MGRAFRWALAIAATAMGPVAAPLAAQVTVAVLPFEDTGSYGQDREAFKALEVGIPALLGTELARHAGVTVVERSRFRALVTPRTGEPRPRHDDAAAAAIAKAAGATHVVFGDYLDFYGKFRVNARLVDVATARPLAAVTNDDPRLQDRADLHRIVRHLAARAAAAIPGAGPADTTAQPAPVPVDAITLYSLGVLSADRGQRARAEEFYRRALIAHPEFSAARDALRRGRSS